MDANSKKAMHFIGFIKQYQELAVTACDAGEFLGRRAEITWKHGDEDVIELRERKWDVLYQLPDYYEKRVLNLKCLLKELVETSDQPLTFPLNSYDVMVFHPPF